MIDTRDRRASVLGFALGWSLLAPAPSGSLASEQKRRQVAHTYAGFGSGTVIVEDAALTASTSSDARLDATITAHPMSNALIVGSTNTVSLKGLRDNETRLYLDDATVELTAILDDTDTPVTGTQNISMPFISGVGRSVLYRGAIPHTAALVAGETYTRRITAVDADGNVRVFDKVIVAEAG